MPQSRTACPSGNALAPYFCVVLESNSKQSGRKRGTCAFQCSPDPPTPAPGRKAPCWRRSEEHTSELQSRLHLVCRLLLEKKKKHRQTEEICRYQRVDRLRLARQY